MTPSSPHQPNGQFIRIEKVLDYIHTHIRMPLTLDMLADASCWSRWQLQRVFQTYTGYSVAQYVREMKLSCAAELVLSTRYRMSDIAYEFGFNSEVAFSRAFKQHFGLSPKAYQIRGTRIGIKARLTRPDSASPGEQVQRSAPVFYQVRIDSMSQLNVHGVSAQVKGLYAATPDFAETIPQIWQSFFEIVRDDQLYHVPHIGIIEHRDDTFGELTYWAGVEAFPGVTERLTDLPSVCLSEQNYAVMRYQGKACELHHAVTWLLSVWLPESGYKGADEAPVLEFYYPPFHVEASEPFESDRVNAEYWLPIHL
ncbi:AraC family transcriptional regulator [Vibrio quintilis]|uniref:Multiple antibiotic resistance protein MarA n=1 Tax=Vibrio quintilis TaxID=1117707 RepID=A0A1M7YUU0_9VIBR|nr:AraC family transcriptional regulator [Vibrio quintilis]SHO56331.1 Multiple antibiotic resistance protein MarA [Vibrio quintilis]